MQQDKITFSFGRNWEEFIAHNFSEERVAIARNHLLGFLGIKDLHGRTFLDIGSGSGIHSLAAFRAGAARVISLDVDPFSVSTTRKLRRRAGDPDHWQVLEGSILDPAFVARLEPADIVYSWGVLHHTGRMWPAIANAGALVREGGLFYIALYTTAPLSAFWLKAKKVYNRAPSPGQRLMELGYFLGVTCVSRLIRFQNPLAHVRHYKASRGMSYYSDVKDWLGGYPFEHAKPEEVLHFARTRLNMELVNMRTNRSAEGNSEYLLLRHPADQPRPLASAFPDQVPAA